MGIFLYLFLIFVLLLSVINLKFFKPPPSFSLFSIPNYTTCSPQISKWFISPWSSYPTGVVLWENLLSKHFLGKKIGGWTTWLFFAFLLSVSSFFFFFCGFFSLPSAYDFHCRFLSSPSASFLFFLWVGVWRGGSMGTTTLGSGELLYFTFPHFVHLLTLFILVIMWEFFLVSLSQIGCYICLFG